MKNFVYSLLFLFVMLACSSCEKQKDAQSKAAFPQKPSIEAANRITKEQISDFIQFSSGENNHWASVLRKASDLFADGKYLPSGYEEILKSYFVNKDEKYEYATYKIYSHYVGGRDLDTRDFTIAVNNDGKIRNTSQFEEFPIYKKCKRPDTMGGQSSLYLYGGPSSISELNKSTARVIDCSDKESTKVMNVVNGFLSLGVEDKNLPSTPINSALSNMRRLNIGRINNIRAVRCATIESQGFDIDISQLTFDADTTEKGVNGYELIWVEKSEGKGSEPIYAAFTVFTNLDFSDQYEVYALADFNDDDRHDLIVENIKYGGSIYGFVSTDDAGEVSFDSITRRVWEE